MPISILLSKMIFIKHLKPARSNLVPKLKVLRIYWNLANKIFQNANPCFWCQKLFLWNIYNLIYPTWSKIESAQNLLKFGTFDISNMPVLILISKIYFFKYILHVRPKLAQKLKMLKIYWNLAYLIF